MRAFILRRVALINNHFDARWSWARVTAPARRGSGSSSSATPTPTRTSTWSRTRRAGPGRPLPYRPWDPAHLSGHQGPPGPGATPRSPSAWASTPDRPAPQSATWWWSAYRPGSRPRCTRPARGWTSWCWRPTPPAGRPARARRSRTTSASTGIWSGAGGQGVHPGPEVRRRSGHRQQGGAPGLQRQPYAIELEGGHRIRARCVVIASGAEYRSWIRRPARFENQGRLLRDVSRQKGSGGRGGRGRRRGNLAGQAAVPRASHGTCTCWCAPAAWRSRCPATSSAASRRARGSRLHPDGDRPLSGNAELGRGGGTARPARPRTAPSATSSA